LKKRRKLTARDLTSISILVGVVVGVGCAVTPVVAEDDSIVKAIKDGDLLLNLRYRWEQVDQDGIDLRAKASTIRLRLGYRTAEWHGLYALGEFAALRVVGAERYNSTANGLTQYPIVADPEDQEVNRMLLGYAGLKKTDFKLGRQYIRLDNERFLGSISWRQLEQTFDAFSVKNDYLKNLTFYYGHTTNVKRISGTHNPNPLLAHQDLDADLLNVAYDTKFGKLVGYAYLLEFKDIPSISHRDLGIRFAGTLRAARRLSVLYA
jgi:hypothetical protein